MILKQTNEPISSYHNRETAYMYTYRLMVKIVCEGCIRTKLSRTKSLISTSAKFDFAADTCKTVMKVVHVNTQNTIASTTKRDGKPLMKVMLLYRRVDAMFVMSHHHLCLINGRPGSRTQAYIRRYQSLSHRKRNTSEMDAQQANLTKLRCHKHANR